MPVVLSNPLFPFQSGPNGTQSYVQQLNFRQMIMEVCAANRAVDPMWAGRKLNNAYREVIGKRDWYALKVYGQLQIPNTISGGQAVAIVGSNIIQGIGTNWTIGLVNSQFRIGFTYPYQNIVAVNAGLQQLTLDTPFGGGQNITGGYNIVQCWVTLGANVDRLLWARNQQQGWPMRVDTPQQTINAWDTWRTQLGWSTDFSPMPPTPDGQARWEVWPTPYQAQVFPFQAWIQPPDMMLDADSPVSFINADLIVTRAIADAKLHGGRSNPDYDPTVYQFKMAEYKTRLEDMENRDNALDQQDVTWDYGDEDGALGWGTGSVWAQSHDA